jgi:drug/metabolite transporter (DMT)-like permease
MNEYEFIICLISVIFGSSSQCLIKISSITTTKKKQIYSLFCAGLFQIISLFLVLIALKTVAISILSPFSSLSFLIIAIISHYLFREELNQTFWIGSFFILLGIILIQ